MGKKSKGNIYLSVIALLLIILSLFPLQDTKSEEIPKKRRKVFHSYQSKSYVEPRIKPFHFSDPRMKLKHKIEQEARKKNISPILAVEIAKCESSLIHDSRGDSGKAYGVFQFWQSTFNQYKEKGMNWKNEDDQIELALEMIASGKGRHWTCYRNLIEHK